MGETAENKILSLIKQTPREEESEANKLLKILRERSRATNSDKPAPTTKLPLMDFPEIAPTPPPPSVITETVSLPGIAALHLFGGLHRDTIPSLLSLVQESQGGWLRYFLSILPLMSVEVAGLSHLHINENLRTYHKRLSLFLHKLLAQWRLRGSINPAEINTSDLDELLIQIVGGLKILVQQGKLQRVTWLESDDENLTLLCTLKPENFVSVTRFLESGKPSLFAHLAFLVEIMAHEVITNHQGQLRDGILIGESLQRVREKLLVLIHRLALRSHLGKIFWEDNPQYSESFKMLFTRFSILTQGFAAEIKGGNDGIF